MDNSGFGIQSSTGDFTGRGRKRPLPNWQADDEQDERDAAAQRASLRAMGQYATTGGNTHVAVTRKGKWPKKRKLEKQAARLRYLNDATGAIQTSIFKVFEVSSTTVANESVCKAFTICTGQGGGLDNDKDIGKLFAQSRDIAVTGAVAALRAKAVNLYLRSVNLRFYVSSTAVGDAVVDMYECVCVRSHDSTETDTSSLANMQTHFFARSPITATNPATAMTATYIHNSPYHWHEFGMFWKITKTTTFNVQAGKQIEFSKNYTINQLLDADKLIGTDYYKGLSRMFLFFTRGTFIGTANSAASVVTSINTYGTYKFTSRGVLTPNLSVAATVIT